MWVRFIGALLGGWIIAAPAALGYSGAAEANDRAIGSIIVASSLIAAWQVMRPLRWVELFAGVWLVAVPWILVRWYEPLSTVNSVGVGLALMVLTLLGGSTSKSFGGGWTSVLPLLVKAETGKEELKEEAREGL